MTPPQIAKLWGVNPAKIVGWIRSGELPAIDASTKRGGRPRYLVDVDELAKFESRRSVVPSQARSVRRRQSQSDDVTKYF